MAVGDDSEDDSDYEDRGGLSDEDVLFEEDGEEDGEEDLEGELGMLAAADFDFITIIPGGTLPENASDREDRGVVSTTQESHRDASAMELELSNSVRGVDAPQFE